MEWVKTTAKTLPEAIDLALDNLGVDESEACRLLHTVIVGGGPTGVEFGAELFDFVQQVRSRLGHIVNTSLYHGCRRLSAKS